MTNCSNMSKTTSQRLSECPTGDTYPWFLSMLRIPLHHYSYGILTFNKSSQFVILEMRLFFMLINAFIGKEKAGEVYSHAISQNYRFYSYGDTSLLIKSKE